MQNVECRIQNITDTRYNIEYSIYDIDIEDRIQEVRYEIQYMDSELRVQKSKYVAYIERRIQN